MLEPVRREAVVSLDRRQVFTLFTTALGSWWPREFSWSGQALHAMVLEPFAGGRCYERGPAGFTCDFGCVLECDPPERILFSWQIDATRAPQPDPSKASEVEVRFVEEVKGTRVLVEHRAFERHGEAASAYRDGMDQGWALILHRLETAAAPSKSIEGPPSLRVCIDVPDVNAAVAFYTGALGFVVASLRDGWATLEGAAVPLDLLQKPAGSLPYSGATLPRSYARHWTPIHLDLAVGDLDRAIARAVEQGARQEREVAAHAWGRIALMSDPFGNGFCLLEFRGRGYDEPT